jgi:pimeloyl-ACP methyl ester carboxylesterase
MAADARVNRIMVKMVTVSSGQRFRIAGSGEPLLLIHGSGGDLDTYVGIEQYLNKYYCTISYERRIATFDQVTGMFLSPTLGQHVEDAVAVLDTCGIGKANIFGSSAGAVVTLCVLSSHPERVTKAIAHEPPVLEVLDDRIPLRKEFSRVLQIEMEQGVEAACKTFFDIIGIMGEVDTTALNLIASAVSRRPISPIREIHPILDYSPELSVLRSQREKLVLAKASLHQNSMPARAVERLAEMLDLRALAFTGNHFGYMDYMAENKPEAFAREIINIFEYDQIKPK